MIYAQHLGDIQDALFQFALERFRLGDFVSAEAIPYGLFGQNVFLKCIGFLGIFIIFGTI